jgi:predicted DNA repair protein MutK
VALIVKMDDVGLHLAATGRTGAGRALGRGLVLAMPKLMAVLSTVGTAAMLWVGGNIVLHGLEVTHLWAWPYETIHHLAETVAHAVPVAQGFVTWVVTATLDGIFGLILGVALIPLVTRVIGPLIASLTGKKAKSH